MNDIILFGDVFACLENLEDSSIAVAITSPPYWKQRDYGFEGQIGQENTSEEYIGRLVVIFNKLRQKLREDGVFFLNIGDKYLSRYGKSHLLQIPYRLAYHMKKDGWNLEDIIIWYKLNHMPSPVEDRFTNTYEPILVFTKNKKNIYQKNHSKVVKIPLQQTPWVHTAVFPEKLVEEMLDRVNLNDDDLILDPFAGTGTVADVIKNIRYSISSFKKIYSIMIEKDEEFIEIIKARTGIENVKKIDDIYYEWKPVNEERLPSSIKSKEILLSKYGEVFIANSSEDFLSALKGITTNNFRSFHREDALYFYGVKNWSIEDLYYVHSIFYEDYVLRNMLIVSTGMEWYPIFMFARDSTRVEYKFYLDRIRLKPKTKENRDWWNEEFIGMKVIDNTGKETTQGRIINIIERYENGFPKIALVQWDGRISLEFILNINEDILIMNSLTFKCPTCGNPLEEPYDPVGENKCPVCGTILWTVLHTLPKIEEPMEIVESFERLKKFDYELGEITNINEFNEKERKTKSKFAKVDRINWGASPGARKLMFGEYFTKMRLYKIDQSIVGQYLTILRKYRKLSIEDIISKLPDSYKHTVGHWFRKDFGGSIPLPEDLILLKKILGIEDGLIDILRKSALKFETVKSSIKGKNPGDFIENLNYKELVNYLEKLYIPPQIYVRSLLANKT